MIRVIRTSALAALSLALVATACKKGDTSATTASDTMPPAMQPSTAPIRVVNIETGKSLGADKHIANATSDFGVRDTMHVAVVTEGATTGANIRAKFTYGDKLVKEMNQTITATGGTNVTNFEIDKATAWPTGSYKVEVFLEGVSAGTKDLTVK